MKASDAFKYCVLYPKPHEGISRESAMAPDSLDMNHIEAAYFTGHLRCFWGGRGRRSPTTFSLSGKRQGLELSGL
jgi:hypothetical protein